MIGYFNLSKTAAEINCNFADCGVPYPSGYGFEMKDIFTGEELGVQNDCFNPTVPAHDCRLYRCRIVRA